MKLKSRKYEDNPFEDELVAKEWINSVENERGMIRERELMPMLADWVTRVKPSVLIDVGMGQGGCADAAQIDKNIRYVGIEPSVILVDRAIEKFSGPNREFMVGNAYDLPIGDSVGDAVFSINVWFHLKDLNIASREFARVLRPKGSFFICTANPDAYTEWQSRFDKDAKVDDEVIDGRVHIPVNPLTRNIIFKHSFQKIEDALTANGLVVDKVQRNGVFDGGNVPLFVNFFGHKR